MDRRDRARSLATRIRKAEYHERKAAELLAAGLRLYARNRARAAAGRPLVWYGGKPRTRIRGPYRKPSSKRWEAAMARQQATDPCKG